MFGIPAIIGLAKWIASAAFKSGGAIASSERRPQGIESGARVTEGRPERSSIVEIPGLERLGCRVIGGLKFSANASELNANMIEARFASGLWVVAGWFPEHSPTGAYVVSVIDEHAASMLTLRKQRLTHDVNEAARIFYKYASEVAGATP
jgi:hypothetical protein